jgi:glyoxylase-like metal-dependent hydrolase (beta-lactamase superfamily II)
VAREAAVRLADGVWRIPTAPRDLISSFAVAGADGGITLVDAGLPFRAARTRLLAGLRAIGADPADVRRVVITHAHPDHTGGLAELVRRTGDAEVLVHEREAVYLRDGRTPRTSRGKRRTFAKVTPTSEFRDGDVLPGGLRVVHVPGHSPGHVALLLEGAGVLIPGDAVVNLAGVRYAPGFLCTDPGRNRSNAADRLGDLDFDTVAFAHGPELRHGARAAVRALLRGRRP